VIGEEKELAAGLQKDLNEIQAACNLGLTRQPVSGHVVAPFILFTSFNVVLDELLLSSRLTLEPISISSQLTLDLQKHFLININHHSLPSFVRQL